MIGAYVLVDSEDRALYVGASIDIATRVRSHRSKAPWWVEVADVWTFPTPDRTSAFERETRLIAEFDPAHNVNRKTGAQRRREPPTVSIETIREVYGDEFAARCVAIAVERAAPA